MTQKQAVWACFEILFQHLSERKWPGGEGERERERMTEKTLKRQIADTTSKY